MGVAIDAPQFEVHEPHEPIAPLGFRQSHRLVSEGRTDEHFVLSLLRETGILCVNGSGFGVPASDGFFRVVFLANPRDLEEIYADIATFTREYLARG